MNKIVYLPSLSEAQFLDERSVEQQQQQQQQRQHRDCNMDDRPVIRFDNRFLTNYTITTIKIQSNCLNAISSADFHHCPPIRNLTIHTTNQQVRLAPDSFRTLNTLTNLTLELNLRTLPATIFEHLLRLQTINLIVKPLVELPPKLFDSNRGLQSITIRFSPATKIPLIFAKLTQLETLKLYSYGAAGSKPVLKSEHFENNTKLKYLLLRGFVFDATSNKLLKYADNVQRVMFDECSLSNNMTFGLYSFRSPRIRYESLRFNRFEKLEKSMFVYCPNLETLNMRRNMLQKLDQYVFPIENRIRDLNFKANMIGKMSGEFFTNLENLLILNCAKNQLETIDTNMFRIPVNLLVLNLKWNRLMRLDANSFERLTQLKFLFLEYNRLERLPVQLLGSLHALKVLNIGCNRLAELTSDLIGQRLCNLTAMNAKRNRIARIAVGFFTHCEQLTYVNFERNRLDELDAKLFDSLVNLRVLNLKRNRIRCVPCGLFANNVRLRSLSLAANRIEELETSVFKTLSQLKLLNLSGNCLRRVQLDGFVAGCPSLGLLDLYANRIENVSLMNLALISGTILIDLRSNNVRVLECKERLQIDLKVTILVDGDFDRLLVRDRIDPVFRRNFIFNESNKNGLELNADNSDDDDDDDDEDDYDFKRTSILSYHDSD